MKTSQHLYKINLAIADFLLGVFTFLPSIYFATKRFNKTSTLSGETVSLASQASMTSYELGAFEHVVGFLSWLSFLVSIITLIAASFDRVFATVFPVRYLKTDSCYITIGTCIMVWIVAVCNLTTFFDSTASVVTTPYFVVPIDKSSELHSLVGRVILLVLMLTNSSVVLLVLYCRNRFVH